MPRVPYFDLQHASAELRDMVSTRKPLNIYRMLPHATTVAPGFLRMGRALLTENELDSQLRELAIVRVGILSGATYEVHQHKRVARTVGLSDEKIEAIAIGADAPVFNELEQMVLRYTDTVVLHVKASDEQFNALLARLNVRQMAELTLAIGFYMMVSRFLENFEVEIEPPGTVV